MIILIVIISFFLDGLLSIYQGPYLFDIISFKPMFTIVSLIVIYPFFTKYRPQYYKICLITGLMYDLIYTNTLFLNMLIFPLLGFIVYRLYELGTECLTNGVVINIIVIAIYHVLTYFILVLAGYLPLDILLLSYEFIGILITNIIFFIVIYCVIKLIVERKRRKVPYSL